MNHRVQATPERARVRARRGRFPVTPLPMLLLLGGLLVWAQPVRGQQLELNQIPINPTNVAVGSVLKFQISYEYAGGTAPEPAVFNSLTNAPAGAIIDSNGNFQWQPTAGQVGTYNITVSAYEQYQPVNSASITFTVIVGNVVTNASGVVIDPILPQTVAEGTTLIFTNHAHATDNTNNALLFSLTNAPAGASMTNNTPTSGVFTWTPTAAEALNSSYTIREIVTEPSASASNYQDFQVTITRTNDCSEIAQFLAAVQQGGYFLLSNCTTIVLSNTLTISNSVTLDAGTNNVTIAGSNLFGLFTILPGVTNFTLRGLTLSGGQTPNGGALYIGQNAVVVLTNCTFAGNFATNANGVAGATGSSGGVDGGNGGNGTAGGPAAGGAIYNLGNLTVLNCQFLTNGALGGTGGAGGGGGNGSGTLSDGGNGGNGGNGAPGDGGAICSAGSLLVSNCSFFGNSVTGGSGGVGGTNGTGRFPGAAGTGGAGMEGSGAAIYSANHAVIVNSTFSGNVGQGGDSAPGGTDSNGQGVSGAAGANSLGGGLCNLSTGFLTNCTFSGNQVTGGFGGNGGTGTSTLSDGGNGGNGGNGLGGGLYNAGSIVVVNCTFFGGGGVGGTNGLAGSGRFAGTSGTPGLGQGGDIAQGAGAFVLQNSILATNTAGGNAYDTSASRITDAGYNISSDSTPNLSGTSLKNTDPQINSTLADNGGPTLTLALLSTNSPAFGRIPTNASPATDQRGIPRPQPPGGLSDIGAYELVTLPAILTQPQSQTVEEGSNAVFVVSAFGDSLTYQWQFDVTNLLANATNASYDISSVNVTNGGSYDVVISDSYGSTTSAVVNLTVLAPPAITTQPSNQTAVVGSNASFSVTAAGTAPLVYQWWFNVTNLIAKATGASYTITSVASTNAGNYGVVISNSYGSVTSAVASLTVLVPPAITTPPSDQTAVVGSSASFSVTATGTAPLSYQWAFEGTNLAGATANPLLLTGVQLSQAGSYAVMVTNVAGSVTSAPAKLNVYVLPYITAQPASQSVIVGSNVTFSVTAAGTPPLSYQWRLNGNSLPAATSSSYAVTNAQMANAGAYDVIVTNDYGSTNSQPATLTLVGPFAISGTITGLSGVLVQAITNSVVASSTNTSAGGNYTLSGLMSNTYTVIPSLACYHFNPTNRAVSVGPTSQSGVDFVALRDAYTISGRITDGGAPAAGVTVSAIAGTSSTLTSVTGSDGSYVISNLCAGAYTVTPAGPCQLFNPTNLIVEVGPDTSGVNFIAYSNNLSRIRGQVTDGGNGLSNVLVTVTGGMTNITDSNGDYEFSSLCPGAYVVTPSLSNYCFNPQSVTVPVGSAQTTNGVDFVATPGTYQISGTLEGMSPGPTVSVSISAVTTGSTNLVAVVTTTNGAYAVFNLCPGAYSVTPSNACYQFYPPSRSTTVGPNDDSLDFAVSGGGAFSIRGQVTHGGIGLGNVTVSAGGQTYMTAADGNYAFSYLCQGSYPVTASLPNFQFEPATNYVTLSSADANNVNFAVIAFPALALTRAADGSFQLAFAAAFTCGVEASTNLESWQAVFLTNNISTNTLLLQVTDTDAPTLPMRFYRLAETFAGPPVLAGGAATNRSISLDGVAASVLACRIEASTNLRNWDTLFSSNLPAAAPFQFSYVETTNLPVRFYRLFQTPGF
jgi:hypothetical protein